jgi:hypothetical protein
VNYPVERGCTAARSCETTISRPFGAELAWTRLNNQHNSEHENELEIQQVQTGIMTAIKHATSIERSMKASERQNRQRPTKQHS